MPVSVKIIKSQARSYSGMQGGVTPPKQMFCRQIIKLCHFCRQICFPFLYSWNIRRRTMSLRRKGKLVNLITFIHEIFSCKQNFFNHGDHAHFCGKIYSRSYTPPEKFLGTALSNQNIHLLSFNQKNYTHFYKKLCKIFVHEFLNLLSNFCTKRFLVSFLKWKRNFLGFPNPQPPFIVKS